MCVYVCIYITRRNDIKLERIVVEKRKKKEKETEREGGRQKEEKMQEKQSRKKVIKPIVLIRKKIRLVIFHAVAEKSGR